MPKNILAKRRIGTTFRPVQSIFNLPGSLLKKYFQISIYIATTRNIIVMVITKNFITLAYTFCGFCPSACLKKKGSAAILKACNDQRHGINHHVYPNPFIEFKFERKKLFIQKNQSKK